MKKSLLIVSAIMLAFAANAQDFVSATEAVAAHDEAAATTAAASAEAAKAEKKSYWKKGLDVSLTGTQNFVSQNTSWSTEWYNGGNSSLSGLFSFNGWYNYAGPENLIWDNLLELKYGIGTNFSKDAAGRAWHLSDDKTAYSTKLGYAIGKGWNVAVNADVTTTLFRNYSVISDNREKMFYPFNRDGAIGSLIDNGIIDAVSSAAISPLRFTTGIGVDWKYTNEAKNIDLSIYIAPYAYKLVYVEDMTKFAQIKDDKDDISGLEIGSISKNAGIGQVITDQAKYDAAIAQAQYYYGLGDLAIMDFHKSLQEAASYVAPNHIKSYNLGSLFDIQYRQKFNDYVSLSSRLQFYTDYKGIEVDWKIQADFLVYKYITAQVCVNPRYDSTVEGNWDVAKLQLKEYVTIGFAYRLEK